MLFVRPALLRQLGASDEQLSQRWVPAEAGIALENNGDRPHYLRGRINGGKFSPVGLQQSHALLSLSRSEALLRLEPRQVLQPGDAVHLWLMD
jgi:molybdopterin molybdotransferase